MITEPPETCPYCLTDPDLVCDACGSHVCWCGRFLCENAYRAGLRKRREGDPP